MARRDGVAALEHLAELLGLLLAGLRYVDPHTIELPIPERLGEGGLSTTSLLEVLTTIAPSFIIATWSLPMMCLVSSVKGTCTLRTWLTIYAPK